MSRVLQILVFYILIYFKHFANTNQLNSYKVQDDCIHNLLEVHCPEAYCDSGDCINIEWICDGIFDCLDTSDEDNCQMHLETVTPEKCSASKGLFLCENKKCIQHYKLCNNIDDCGDSSDEDTVKCNMDANKCGKFGICDQNCRNTAGSYECSCQMGYKLQKDNRTCKVEDNNQRLYFATKWNIYTYSFATKEADIFLKDIQGHNIRGLAAADYDSIYWSDVSWKINGGIILKSSRDGVEAIVTSGLANVDSIAIDWITQNIYFVDSQQEHIGVCSNNGRYCKILHGRIDINKPNALVLMPQDKRVGHKLDHK